MADPTVKLIFSGNSQDAERALASLERRFDSVENKLKRMSAQARSTGKDTSSVFKTNEIDSLASGIGKATVKLVGMGAVAKGIQVAFQGMSGEIKAFNQGVSDFWEKQRSQELKLQIQGGFTPEQVQNQIPAMKTALWATPSAQVGEAVELQTQLSGAGFKPEDINSGAALKTMLDLKAVTNSFGEGIGDPKQSVLGMSQLIKGLGNVDPTAGDIRRIGAKTASLMKESDIQFEDLKELSGEAATLKQFGLSESEQLGAFSWMRDVKGASEGATGLRIFTSRTATAGTDKARTEALKSIGLNPEDVAMAKGGVTYDQAIERIQGGMSKLSEEDKNKFLVDMYGEKGQSSAAIMLDSVGSRKIRERVKMAEEGEADFKTRLETFQGSRESLMTRNKNSADWKRRQEAIDNGLTWGEFRQIEDTVKTDIMARQETPEGRRAAGMANWIGGKVSGMAEGMGYQPQDLFPVNPNELLQLQQKQLDEAKKINENLNAIKNQRPINRNGNGEN